MESWLDPTSKVLFAVSLWREEGRSQRETQRETSGHSNVVSCSQTAPVFQRTESRDPREVPTLGAAGEEMGWGWGPLPPAGEDGRLWRLVIRSDYSHSPHTCKSRISYFWESYEPRTSRGTRVPRFSRAFPALPAPRRTPRGATSPDRPAPAELRDRGPNLVNENFPLPGGGRRGHPIRPRGGADASGANSRPQGSCPRRRVEGGGGGKGSRQLDIRLRGRRLRGLLCRKTWTDPPPALPAPDLIPRPAGRIGSRARTCPLSEPRRGLEDGGPTHDAV